MLEHAEQQGIQMTDLILIAIACICLVPWLERRFFVYTITASVKSLDVFQLNANL